MLEFAGCQRKSQWKASEKRGKASSAGGRLSGKPQWTVIEMLGHAMSDHMIIIPIRSLLDWASQFVHNIDAWLFPNRQLPRRTTHECEDLTHYVSCNHAAYVASSEMETANPKTGTCKTAKHNNKNKQIISVCTDTNCGFCCWLGLAASMRAPLKRH